MFQLALLVICISLPASMSAAASDNKSEPRLLWSADLRKAGYSIPWNPSQEADRQIAFGSPSELVILNVRDTEARAFVLDAVSGSVAHERTWSTSGWPYIFATAGGGYVAVTDKGMTLFTAGLKEIAASTPYSAKHASPDGKSVAVWSADLKPGHGLTQFLDTESLRPTGVEVLDTYVMSISFAHTVTTGVRMDGNRTILYQPEDEDHPPYDTTCPGVNPRFISNSHVAVFGCGKVEVLSTQGERLFAEELEGGPAAVGRDGSRFASYQAYTRGHWSKLRKEVFTIFDIRRKGKVSSLIVKELRGRENSRSGVALSPDGSQMAINSLGIVRLYALPPGQ